MLKKFLILGIIFSSVAYAWKSSSWSSSSSSSSLKSSIGSSYNATYYTHNPTGKQVMDMATGKTGWESGDEEYFKCYEERQKNLERLNRGCAENYNKTFNDFSFNKNEKIFVLFSILGVCLAPFVALGICEAILQIFKI